MADLREELTSFASACAMKRAALATVGSRRATWRKRLHLVSGILALLSGAGITSVITDLTSSFAVKILSAAVAFASGIISLLIAGWFDEKETIRIYEGSAKFLALRDQANLLASKPDVTDKQIFSALQKLHEEYARHSKDFDHFIPTVAMRSYYRMSLSG